MPAGIPREKKDPRPHRTALFEAAARRARISVMTNDLNPRELSTGAYKQAYGLPTDTSEELRMYQERDALAFEDLRTWCGAIWGLRKHEMDARQKRRDEHVAKYRPIQTLDGLDPSPRRVAMREVVNTFRVLGTALGSVRW